MRGTVAVEYFVFAQKYAQLKGWDEVQVWKQNKATWYIGVRRDHQQAYIRKVIRTNAPLRIADRLKDMLDTIGEYKEKFNGSN